jgi:hypothetical protein
VRDFNSKLSAPLIKIHFRPACPCQREYRCQSLPIPNLPGRQATLGTPTICSQRQRHVTSVVPNDTKWIAIAVPPEQTGLASAVGNFEIGLLSLELAVLIWQSAREIIFPVRVARNLKLTSFINCRQSPHLQVAFRRDTLTRYHRFIPAVKATFNYFYRIGGSFHLDEELKMTSSSWNFPRSRCAEFAPILRTCRLFCLQSHQLTNCLKEDDLSPDFQISVRVKLT